MITCQTKKIVLASAIE
ncbi:DUF3102 domain-containing protein, partial [Dehalobacter sp. 12DCB1]